MEFEKTKRILAALDRHEVNYVLGGGMAMAAQGLVRAARDIGSSRLRQRDLTAFLDG